MWGIIATSCSTRSRDCAASAWLFWAAADITAPAALAALLPSAGTLLYDGHPIAGLTALRVTPYYLHHCDLARGTSHFRTTIAEGLAIMQALRGHLSGVAIPSYVLDLPTGAAIVCTFGLGLGLQMLLESLIRRP